MGLFFVLQQMNVPLAQFFIDALFRADIDLYFRVILTALMIGIQVFAVLAFNFLLIADFAGDSKKYKRLLSRVRTAATTNYEIYRYEYRFWIVLEVFYELLNSLWINIGSRGYPDVYWLNVVCHLLYTYLHARLQPSFYPLHNWVSVSVGISQVLADVSVLESMYGSGSLSESGTWTLVCGGIPVGVGVLDWIYLRCRGEIKDSKGRAVEAKVYADVENKMLETILLFLFAGTGGGLVFLSLVSVIGWERPPGSWWSLYVVAPLATAALYVLSFFTFHVAGVTLSDCMNTVCKVSDKVVCWWKKVQTHPAGPEETSEDPVDPFVVDHRD
jgi:hypothetical protein